MFSRLQPEFRPMIRLAAPVVLAELGWMSMTLVDTIIVGPLGPAAIGAVGTGSNIFFAVIFLGMGRCSRWTRSSRRASAAAASTNAIAGCSRASSSRS